MCGIAGILAASDAPPPDAAALTAYYTVLVVMLMNGRMLRLIRGGRQNTSTRTRPRSSRTRHTTP